MKAKVSPTNDSIPQKWGKEHFRNTKCLPATLLQFSQPSKTVKKTQILVNRPGNDVIELVDSIT